jgi:hypothetical protein
LTMLISTARRAPLIFIPTFAKIASESLTKWYLLTKPFVGKVSSFFAGFSFLAFLVFFVFFSSYGSVTFVSSTSGVSVEVATGGVFLTLLPLMSTVFSLSFSI